MMTQINFTLNMNELKEAVSFARANLLPIFALGGGSNVLVSDDGFAATGDTPQGNSFDDYKLNYPEIDKRPSASIFDLISVRYLKTAYDKLLQKKQSTPAQ